MKIGKRPVALRADTRKRATQRNRLTPIETRQFAPGLKFASWLSSDSNGRFIGGELRPSKPPRFTLRVFAASPDTKLSRNFTKTQHGPRPSDNRQSMSCARFFLLLDGDNFGLTVCVITISIWQTSFADFRGSEPCCFFVLVRVIFVSRRLDETRRVKRCADTPRTPRRERIAKGQQMEQEGRGVQASVAARRFSGGAARQGGEF